jgi:hypothetical protein
MVSASSYTTLAGIFFSTILQNTQSVMSPSPSRERAPVRGAPREILPPSFYNPRAFAPGP